jgi:hypothetical protein
MGTGRYSEVISGFKQLDLSAGWLRDYRMAGEWNVIAHHIIGDFTGAEGAWNRERVRQPQNYRLCEIGIRLYAARGKESVVDSLVSQCAALPGAPLNRIAGHLTAAREYRVHGFRAAGQRSAQLFLASLNQPTRQRALVLAELGDWRSAYEARLQLGSTDPIDRAELAVAGIRAGDTLGVGETLRFLEEWPLSEPRLGRDHEGRALILAALGDLDGAIASLRRAKAEGRSPQFTGWHRRIEFEPLQNDPRYKALVRLN